MKTWTKIILALLIANSVFSCEKDVQAPEKTYALEAEAKMLVLNQAEAELGLELDITTDQLELAIKEQKSNSHQRAMVTCYDYCDLLAFLDCFGSSDPECLIWDLNGDGIVSASDLTALLGAYGCDSVSVDAAISLTGTAIHIMTQLDGRVRNMTQIDGEVWIINYDETIFDQVNWYFDGVLVSNDPQQIQIEYPGATDFDVDLDCTKGYHELVMEVIVECQVYTVTTCVGIKLDGLPLCTDDYCTI